MSYEAQGRYMVLSDFFRWLSGQPPRDTTHSLAAGEPPLPGLDRHHRKLPPAWLASLQGRFRGLSYRVNRWIRNGCPLIPQFQMNSRSPHFVILVLVLFTLGMILPELLGLTSGSSYLP